MFRCILVLLLAFGLVFSAQAEAVRAGGAGVPVTAVILPEGGTAVYQKPVETADATGHLPQGAAVTVDTLGIYWCRVSDGTQTGYVPAAALHLDDWGAIDPGAQEAERGPRLAVFNVGMSPAGHWTLTIRDTASRKAAKVDAIIGGTVMAVLEKGTEFTLVHVNGKVGYVLTKYLTFFDAAQTPEKYAVVSNEDKVSLRYDRRFGNTGIITFLQPGTVVTLIWEKKGWACVEAEGCQGYIVSEFLKITE